MTTTRIQWIDICKGLAIFLVVLGHTLRNDISYIYIYSFHMPLFFFLSGLVLNRNKYTFKNFLKSRFSTLILPYIFFYLLTYTYWLLIENHFRSFDMTWYKPLLGMIYGGQYNGLMDHNGILWFLPCLFVVEMLFFVVSTLKTELQVIIVIVMLMAGSQIKIVLPWCLNIAMCALPFFYMGNILKQRIMMDSYGKKNIICFLFFGVIYGCACYSFPNRIAMAVNLYNNISLFIFYAFLGIGVMISFSKSVDILRFKIPSSGILRYLGCNTLVIFALHQPILRILTFVSKKLFTNFPLESNVFFAMGVSVVVILCLLPLIKLYKMFVEPQFRKLYL